MTWSEIKTTAQSIVPAELKGFVNYQSGSVTELALYCRMIHNRISGHPHKCSFLLREYTLTLTGASSYNLRTLIPDLVRLYMPPHGSNVPDREVPYQGYRDYSIDTGNNTRMTLFGKTMMLTAGGVTGTLTIPYYSSYLVESAAGTRKKDLTDDTDFSIIPNEHENVLIEGIVEFAKRKTKNPQNQRVFADHRGRISQMTPFEQELQNLIIADRPIIQGVYEIRYNP